MLSRTISISIGSVLLISLVVLVASCDETRHYEVMTFFFDGVEPPESLRVAADLVDPNLLDSAQQPQGPIWYVHKPVHEPPKKCNNCHSRRGQRRPTAKAFLITPVPQLCYDCHDERLVMGPYVHGPVAVGECVFCHNPHKSQIKYLLEKGGVPQLCYSCHDKDGIELIPDHSVTELSSCMDCHYAHASLERPLLKEDARRLSRERTVRRTAQSAQKPSEKQGPTARPDGDTELLRRKREIAEIFYASMDLYRQGRLVEARQGLVTVINSGLIPQAMGETIRGYISDIDKRIAKRTK